MKPNFLVLCGDGINCERETAKAFELAGGRSKIMHINDLLDHPKELLNYQGLAFPGGFSFGDELGSGQILALKIRHQLFSELSEFVNQKKAIIGICNGFQVLTKLGLLPNFLNERSVALAKNEHGQFLDRWIELKKVEANRCVWTKGLNNFYLPVRHGEGRVVFKVGAEEKIYEELLRKGQIVLEYCENINGSYRNIAGLCDETGLIFGLMPHPEAAVSKVTYPSRDTKNPGLSFFKNIITHLQQQ